MSLNPYSMCPCGSGKKLKFCCKDLAPDIEKIYRFLYGDQPHAALKLTESLLKKHPDRGSLLELCGTIQLQMQEFDNARDTIERFLALHPKSPQAHALHAMLLSWTESGSSAIGPLQDALELLDDDMPEDVMETIATVGIELVKEGQLFAGRAHLLLYAGISPEVDNMAMRLLVRLNLTTRIPLLLRESYVAKACPKGAPWKVEFDHGLRASARGQWRAAEAIFSSLREKVGAEPEIVYNLALVRGWLADKEGLAKGLHEFASLPVPEVEAAAAEALAQLVDPSCRDPESETVFLSYAIRDEDQLIEIITSDSRIELSQYDLPETDSEEERPRDRYCLLDKVPPRHTHDLEIEEIPNVLANLSFYGKRTDRDARLVVILDKDEKYEVAKELLLDIAGEALSELCDEEVINGDSRLEQALGWRWHLPEDISEDEHRRLSRERWRYSLVEKWTTLPQATLGNKSPLEAVADPAMKIPLLGALLRLFQATPSLEDFSIYNEVRAKLGLPPAERIDPGMYEWDLFPIIYVPLLDLSQVGDKQLEDLHVRSQLYSATLATELVARELIQRAEQSQDASIDPREAFQSLLRLETDPAKTKNWAAKARQWARDHQQREADWILFELRLAIEDQDSHRLYRVLEEVREYYSHDSEVIQETYTLLYESGLIPDETLGDAQSSSSPLHPTSLPEGSPSAASGKLWMPEEASASEPIESSGSSKIWTP